MNFPKSLEGLEQQFERLAWLSFRQMELSGEWGDPGQEQILSSFCRVVLRLPSDVPLEYAHLTQFNDRKKGRYTSLNIEGLSLEVIQTQIEEFVFIWQEREYVLEDARLLTEDLQKAGFDVVIQGGYYGKSVDMILACGQTIVRQGVCISTLNEEVWCTPTILMSITAMIAHEHVCIRLYSLRAVFYQKWVSFAQYGYGEDTLGSRLSMWIKRHAIVNLSEDLIACEALFVADMYDNVLYHELGHAVIQHHVLPIGPATMGEGAKLLEDLLFIDLLEVLAEVAPVLGDLEGPLWHMIRIAQTDKPRAERMFWIYWSDSWFFDTKEAYMYGYSGYVSLIMAQAVVEDQIDFDRLRTVIEAACGYTLMYVQTIYADVLDLIMSFEYQVEEIKMDYSTYVEFLGQSSTLPDSAKENAYLKQSWLFRELFEYIESHPKWLDSVLSVLKAHRISFEQGFYQVCTQKMLEGSYDCVEVLSHFVAEADILNTR